MGTITTRKAGETTVETETFTYDNMVLIEERWGDDATVTRVLSVSDLSGYGDGSDTVSVSLSRRKDFGDGSTDFGNFAESLYITKAQALAFAQAIINECSN